MKGSVEDYFTDVYQAVERTYHSLDGFPDISNYMLAFYNMYLVSLGLRPAALLLVVPRMRTDALVHSACKHLPDSVRMATLETTPRISHVLVYNPGVVMDSEQLMTDLYTCMSKYKLRSGDATAGAEVVAALRRLLGYRCNKGFPCASADGRVSNMAVNYSIENPMFRRMQLFSYCCTPAEHRRNAAQIEQLRVRMQDAMAKIDGGSTRLDLDVMRMRAVT